MSVLIRTIDTIIPYERTDGCGPNVSDYLRIFDRALRVLNCLVGIGFVFRFYSLGSFWDGFGILRAYCTVLLGRIRFGSWFLGGKVPFLSQNNPFSNTE